MYPGWLDGLDAGQGQGTWVLAPAGRRACLDPIAADARAAGHPAEQHDAGDIPGLAVPPESAAALWLPTEASIDSHALLEVLTSAVARHPRALWLPPPARPLQPRAGCC